MCKFSGWKIGDEGIFADNTITSCNVCGCNENPPYPGDRFTYVGHVVHNGEMGDVVRRR